MVKQLYEAHARGLVVWIWFQLAQDGLRRRLSRRLTQPGVNVTSPRRVLLEGRLGDVGGA